MRLVTFFVLLSASLAGQEAAPGNFEGRVVDEFGSPMPAAKVRRPVAVRTPGGGMRLLPPFVEGSVETDADGFFAITAVPAGEYFICAVSDEPNRVSSCSWNQMRTLWPVTEGETVVLPDLPLRSTREIAFVLLDPDDVRKGRFFRLGIAANGSFRPAFATSPEEPDTYRVTVPQGLTCRLFFNGEFDLEDWNGELIPSQVIATEIPDGDGITTLFVTVRERLD